ncbi:MULTISPECIES: hypothetical protein [Streptomyces]|uniref:Uncharacterized protein n=1 Tax=Streptomyces ortus TaxID=2867268 RepID=A0ABT3V6W4_9ACTN|nr:MULTISPECIES: hypothetical protein [Streptomyces]MCX4235732.1 hypothetical protein [Streptomyces ortus]
MHDQPSEATVTTPEHPVSIQVPAEAEPVLRACGRLGRDGREVTR